VAEEQTKGRGRIGRSWYSPPELGLWFSVILRPSFAASDSTTISLAGALGIAGALEGPYGVRTRIKWPNDIMVAGRKICGILTEGEFSGDRINFVVLGVGLNVLGQREDFPPELRDLATSLEMASDREIKRTEVLSAVLYEIERRYVTLSESGFEGLRREILSHSMLVGSVVKVMTGSGVLEGVAADIDEKGALMVRKENGTLERVIAGDVVRIA
jgi:BirA family biotin operon repressor/biotin-[acetyl-CoA-carboxylase] ligase